MSNILALDLGSKTGWALNEDGAFHYGMNEWANRAELCVARQHRFDRRCDVRVTRLFRFLEMKIRMYRIDTLLFEDVLFSSTRMQTQLWSSFRAAVWLASEKFGCLIDCLNTTALKRHATGMPSANKERMIATLKKRMPKLDFSRIDDNVADAIWLWDWGKEHIKL